MRRRDEHYGRPVRRVPAGDCGVPREGAGMVEERVKQDDDDSARVVGAYWGSSMVLLAAALTGWFGWQFGAASLAFGLLIVAIFKAGKAGMI